MANRRRLASKLRELFSRGGHDEESLEDLEDALIEADLGVKVATEIVDSVRSLPGSTSRDEVLRHVAGLLAPLAVARPLRFSPDSLRFLLVVGVNGVGKTTALARLARLAQRDSPDRPIVLCAGDTFRAAAIEQLEVHAERLGVRIVRRQQGSDPGAVVYDALAGTEASEGALILADTAGRMHNKEHLVRELQKIDRIVTNRVPSSAYEKLLVIDANTGQNALRQAEVFHTAVGVDSIFLAKYDSTAKGGVALLIQKELGIPISFVGVGERYDDVQPFDPDRFVAELVGIEE